MKVLHVLSSLSLPTGGPVVALRGLARAQKAIGDQPSVVASFHRSHSPDTIVAALEKAEIPVQRFGPVWDTRLNWHPKLAGLLRDAIAETEIVHLHGLWEEIHWQAACIAESMRVPFVIRPCGMLDPWSLSQGKLHKLLYLRFRLNRMIRAADAIHFTTVEECALARPLIGKTKAIIEPNGIDLADYQTLPARGALRERLAIPPDQPVILFLGRLHPKKGIPFLIEALASIAHKDTVLLIAGPNEDGHEATLRRLAESKGVTARVRFLGEIHNHEKRQAYVDADLFALTSHQENFGNAVLEALACGLPVIVSDKVNLCDFVRSEGLGSVVPISVDAVTKAIDGLLDDQSERQRIASVARPLVLTQFDWKQIALAWRAHYEKLKSKSSTNKG